MAASESNRDKIQRFATAVLNNDQVTAESMLHPDFTINEPASLTYGGTYRGIAGCRSLYEAVASAWSELKIDPLTLVGDPEGNQFGWLMNMSGRSSVTGKAFETQVFERWVLKEGLIHELRPYYWDTKALAELQIPEA